MSSSCPPFDITQNTLSALQATLLNTSGDVPLARRFRALFTLKSLGTSAAAEDAIRIIAQGFSDSSALLKHELAYVLGQMGDLRAVPVLESLLEDLHQDGMVRHEAAEALGALSSTTSIPVLRRYLTDSERCVKETCEIALARIEWTHSQGSRGPSEVDGLNTPQFTSVDPAPPSIFPDSSASLASQIDQLRTALTTRTLSLFERYRAMFALRNIAGLRRADSEKAAVDALTMGFGDDSELFKHEIAFVFGQLSTPYSIPALLHVLRDDNESPMVRHEAAEALGGIVGEVPRDPDSEPIDVFAVLKEWSQRKDAPQVVRESCIVAIDMWEYENSNEFQYANGLDTTPPRNIVELNAVPQPPDPGDTASVAQVVVSA